MIGRLLTYLWPFDEKDELRAAAQNLQRAIEQHTQCARDEIDRAHQEIGQAKALNGVLKGAIATIKHGEEDNNNDRA